MKTAIVNAKIVTSTTVLGGYVCGIENGQIVYLGKEDFSFDEVIDAQGGYLIPGFVDIHCHGALGMAFMDGDVERFQRIADYHLAHGTTTLLASTSTSTMEEIESALRACEEYRAGNPKTTVVGVHMEGPWVNQAQCGAQASQFMRQPSAEDLKELKAKYPCLLRAGAAPELGGGLEFARVGKELGLTMSVAHTDADFSEIERAKDNGYTIMTHLYSGMKGVTRKNSYRIAGAVEAGLYFDELYAEVIADGKHLPLELLKFIYKCKGADKICLVTDATRGCGLADGEQTIGVSGASATPIIVEDGVAKLLDRQSFAGSTATCDRLYRTMAQAIGKDMVALSKMASLTPARAMGWTDVGEIAVGKKADLLIINENLEIEKIITEKEN